MNEHESTAGIRSLNVGDELRLFFDHPSEDAQEIYNEHSLQLELGVYFRSRGYKVQFERPFSITAPVGSTRKPKRELDLLLTLSGHRTAIELKVPLAGRVPETMYDFCADISFVEGLVSQKIMGCAYALLITDNRQFWTGQNSGIYNLFREADSLLNGHVYKPTGDKDSVTVIAGKYRLAILWKPVVNSRLISDARYLLVEVQEVA